jgi:hypothetical protein
VLDRGGDGSGYSPGGAVLGLETSDCPGRRVDVADEWHGLTFRGSVRAPEAVGLAARLLGVPGTAVLGLSRRAEPPDRTRDLIGVAEGLGMTAELRGVGADILDGPAWLLIMRLGV